MPSNCHSKSDSEQLQLTSSNPLYLADLLQKQLEKLLFGSFMFNFITDTNLTDHGISLSARVFEFIWFLLVLLVFLFFDDPNIWMSNPKILEISQGVAYIFHSPMVDGNPEQMFVSPPIYLVMIILMISLIEYFGFFLYRSKRFLEPYIQKYFIFICEVLSPLFFSYSLIATIPSVALYIFSPFETRYLHWIIPSFTCISIPALVISLIRNFTTILSKPIPYAPNDPKKALTWYFCICLSLCLETLLYTFARNSNYMRIFLSLLVTFICAYCCLMVFSRFFISQISQGYCLSISLIGCFNGFLAFLHTLLSDTSAIVWISVLLIFDFFFVIFSFCYVSKQTHDLEAYLILNAGAVSSQFPPDEFLHLFTFVCVYPKYAFDDQNLIETIFRCHPTAYRLQLFILRYLLKKGNFTFINKTASDIAKLNTESFLFSFQADALLVISAELINKNESSIWIREQQQNVVVRDCVKAHAKFWRAVLKQNPSNIFLNLLNLSEKVDNANSFFLHNGIKKHLNDRYGQAYIDFLMNVSFDYDGYLDFVGRDVVFNEDAIKLYEINDDDSNILNEDEVESPDMIVDKNYEIYKNANDYKHKSLTVSLYTLVVIEVVVFLVAVFLICISAYLMALYGPKPTESRQLHESSSIFNRAISSFLCYKISDYLSMPSSIYSNRSYVINLLNSAKSMKTISQIFYDYNLSNISTNSLDKPKLKNNSQIYLNKSLKSNYEQVDRNANSEYDNVSKFDLRMTKEAEKGAIINLNYYIETFDILLSFVDRNYSSTLEFINNEDYVEIVERVTLTTNMVLQIYKNKIIKINQSAGYLINFYKYISDYLNYVYSVELIVLIVCVCILAHTIRLRCVEILKIPKSSVSIVYHYFFDQLPFSETRFLSKSTKSAIREFFEYFVFFIIFLVQLLIFYAFFASAQKIVGNLSNISISVFNTASIYPYYFIGLYQELFLFSNHSNKRDYMFNVLLDARILLRISDTNKNETEIVPDLNINEIKPIFPFVSIPVRPVKVHNYYLNDAATRSNQLFHWIRKIIFSLIESLLSVQNGIGNILSSNIDILFLFMPFANDYMADEITIFIWTLCSQHVGFGFTIVLMFFSIISLCTYSIKRMLFMLRSTKFTNRIIALAPMDTPFVDPVSGSFVYPTPPPAVGTSDIISNFPVGFITVDKTDTIIDMNETAQEFYGGSDIIGCKTSEIKLTKSYTDDGKTRKFVVQKGKMRKLPYLYPYEEIDGYEYLFINETTKQYNTEIQIKQLNTELIEQHKLLMPASLGNYHNFDIDHIIFLKQYCFVDIEFPDDFENDYFMAIKENVFDIASQFSTLFFLNYRRSSTYALFSSFNVRSHQRQFIRDALKCAQCLYSLFNNNRETNKVKIVISQGKKCISCLNDKRNVSFTFHSKSNYKSAKLMMQANPGDIIIEKSLLNYATDIDIKYNQSETFSINGNTCEYVVLDKGIQFTDGFRYNPTNL